MIEGLYRDPVLGVTRARLRRDGREHRVYLRDAGTDPLSECSCGDAQCPAIDAVLEGDSHPPETADKDRDPGHPLAVFFDLDDQLIITLRVAGAPAETGIELRAGAALADPPPRFVDPAERPLFVDLAREPGPCSLPVLRSLAATGRVRWRGQIVGWGDTVTVATGWARMSCGEQRLRLHLADSLKLLSRAPAVAIDPARASLHALDCGCGPGLAPPAVRLPLEAVDEWRERSGEDWAACLDAPFQPEDIQYVEEPPKGMLRLAPDPDRSAAIEVSAHFGYGPQARARCDDPAPRIAEFGPSRTTVWVRDPDRERALREALGRHGFDTETLGFRGGILALARLSLAASDELRHAGWQVNIEGLPTIRTLAPADLRLQLDATGGRLWSGRGKLDLDAGRLVDGERVFLQSSVGDIVIVPRALYDDVRAALRGNPEQAIRRAAALPIETDAAEEWAPRLNALRDADAAPPPELRHPLRSYQVAGYGWLQRLWRGRFGALLADDMGLGKTIQALAHVQQVLRTCATEPDRTANRVLVVAPASVAGNWLIEARRFTPELSTALYHGERRRASWLNRHQLIVTTYALLRRDIDTLGAAPWALVILDEAQAIKNAASATARAARRLVADQRVALTGTPLENHLGELWSLMRFVEPDVLGPRTQFERELREPIEQRGDRDRRSALARRMAPFFLRRRRADVLGELPPVTESDVMIDLGDAQRALYETVRASALSELSDQDDDSLAARGQVLAILTRLRQICCAPELLPEVFPNRDAPSAKLDQALRMLAELTVEGHRVLVFSQFRSLLRALRTRLESANVASLELTGQTRDRDTVIARFQQGVVPVFLISLKAGGAGLNLTTADTVMLLDPWWNPAVEAQAIARAHRMGQTQPVLVYRLLAAGTIEEDIQRLKSAKHDLAAGLEADVSALDPTDPTLLRQLLEGGQ